MASSLVSLSNELAALVENFAAPVVHGRPRFNSSGVHWSPGVVATAEHTLRHDEDIFVTTGAGDKFPAEVAGRDPGTDLAVLRVKDLTIPAARQAEGSAPRPGNLIVLIGRNQQSANAAVRRKLVPSLAEARGTSFSAALVSGVVARVLQKLLVPLDSGATTVEGVRNWLQTNASRVGVAPVDNPLVPAIYPVISDGIREGIAQAPQ